MARAVGAEQSRPALSRIFGADINNRYPKNILSIQILRGIAAMLVVASHVIYARSVKFGGSPFPKGGVGVDIFFAISGAVMFLTAPYLRPSDFLKRRIIRIVPLYWIFTGLKLVLIALTHAGDRKIPLTLSYILSTFLFIPAFDGDGLVYPVIIAGWTLSFEMYFYLVCAIAILCSPRHILPICTLVIGASVLAGMLTGADTIRFAPQVLVLPITLEFIGGMAAVKLWLEGMRIPVWACPVALAAALAWLATVPDMGSAYSSIRIVYWGAPGLVFLMVALSLEGRISPKRFAPLLMIGEASYALYLSHTAVIPILGGLVRSLVSDTYYIASIAIFVCTIVAGLIIHFCIERPLIKWLVAASRHWPVRSERPI